MRDLFDELILDPAGTLDRFDREVIGPVDTRVCVPDTKAFPFRFICNFVDVRLEDAPADAAFCTGTLIGPRTVLTAGHCLPGMAPGDLRVVPGRKALQPPPFGSSLAARLVPAPGFVEVSPTDYAVVVLRDPIGNRTGWWTYDPFRWPGDAVGTCILQSGSLTTPVEVRVCGYPGDLPAATHLGGRSDPCFVSGVDLKATVQYLDVNTALRISPQKILEYLNDTFGGMSGSPVLRELPATSGGRIMVAVHIAGDDGISDVANRGVFIHGPVLEFIRAHAFYPPGATPAGSAGRPTVRFGSKGAAVRELQYRLNIWIAITPSAGMPPLVVDGGFGSKTLAAARGFQKAFALLVDGIVGPQTWNRLVTPF